MGWTEKERFHLWFTAPVSTVGWAGPGSWKPGTQPGFPMRLVGTRLLEPSSTDFQGLQPQESGMERRPKTRTPVWNAGCCMSELLYQTPCSPGTPMHSLELIFPFIVV